MTHAQNAQIALGALFAMAVAAPAAAEQSSVSGADFAKTEAIIGGTSRLAAILAEQGAPARAVPMQVRPASYRIQLTRVRSTTAATSPSPGVLSGRPDLFGTVALKVGRTPLDARWNRVEHARVHGAAARYAAALHRLSESARIDAINRYVNARVRFTNDDRQFGRADVWSTANDTLARGRGDCEDYAIAKIQMLRAAGFSNDDIYFVILRDLVRRADHAVAVVRSGGHMLVLDNGTDTVLDSESVSDYHPVFTFAANGTWTHGYRVSRPTISVASADPRSFSPALRQEAGDDYRSPSASLLAFNTGFSR